MCIGDAGFTNRLVGSTSSWRCQCQVRREGKDGGSLGSHHLWAVVGVAENQKRRLGQASLKGWQQEEMPLKRTKKEGEPSWCEIKAITSRHPFIRRRELVDDII